MFGFIEGAWAICSRIFRYRDAPTGVGIPCTTSVAELRIGVKECTDFCRIISAQSACPYSSEQRF